MNSRSLAFRNNFINEFEKSEFTSLRGLSLAAGVSASRAQKIVSGDFDGSPVGPGIFQVDSFCQQLGCTPNDLLGYASTVDNQDPLTRGGEPTIERLVSCYVSSGGHINGFSEYLNFCQIYNEPEDHMINLYSNGPLSLASRASGSTDLHFLQSSFFGFSAETRSQIFHGQRTAWERGMGIEATYLNHNMPEQGRRARFDFLRAAFRVTMADKTEKLLVYCTLIDQQFAQSKP